jgi:hypothetical protein
MMMHRLTDVVATTKHTVLSLESLRKFDHRRFRLCAACTGAQTSVQACPTDEHGTFAGREKYRILTFRNLLATRDHY